MKNKAKMSTAQRAEAIMMQLADELPEVRLEIAKSFPAYNSLLNLHAKSFIEFALLPIAREQGFNVSDPLFDYKTVLPYCPQCNKQDGVIHKGAKSYCCNHCNIKFRPNYNSISSGFKLPSVVWRKILECMLNFYTLETACDYCGITPTTYYNIRNRIFYAMQLMMDEVKLYGNIQCDNTFVHLSYKGTKLIQEEYPEDSPFGNIEIASRKARKRGGSYSYAEKNKNSICIFAAIDEYGHVLTRMAGIGSATGNKLYKAVGSTRYLYVVPHTDPFDLMPEKKKIPHSNSGSSSLLIADCEGAIRKYASKIHFNFESNVYRIDGKQVRLKEGAHDIQRVNSLHSRLKNYLRKLNYVSGKYLPGFLTMFEFIENTGASEEAIGRLFEILARPGLDQDKTFFDNMFTIPIIEKKDDKTNKKEKTKSQNQPLIRTTTQAIYLYDQLLRDPQGTLSLKYISQITHFSEENVQKMYEEAKRSGALETIIQTVNASNGKKPSWVQRTIPADYLKFYDEFLKLKKSSSARVSLRDFVIDANQKYNTNLSYGMVKYYFKQIVEYGLREPVPEQSKNQKIPAYKETQEKCMAIYQECLECYNAHRANDDKITWGDVYAEIGVKHNRSASGIAKLFHQGRNILKE